MLVVAGVVVIGVVVVVALVVATTYSKRQTPHLATETVLSTDSAIAVSVPVNPLRQAGEDEDSGKSGSESDRSSHNCKKNPKGTTEKEPYYR